MNFSYVNSCLQSKKLQGALSTTEIVAMKRNNKLVEQFREGDAKAKHRITAICPLGIANGQSLNRNIRGMQPNGMGMIDLDHLDLDYADLRAFLCAFCESEKKSLERLNVEMVYITCSGKGIRIIYPLYHGKGYIESAVLLLDELHLKHYIPYLDTVVTDVCRLSILTHSDDYIYYCDHDGIVLNTPKEGNVLEKYGLDISNIKDWVKNLKSSDDAGEILDSKDEAPKAESQEEKFDESNLDSDTPNESKVRDKDNVEFKNYPDDLIVRNDSLYSEITFKGRLIRIIADTYVMYRTSGQGPEEGERHTLYTTLCRNFRNLTSCDPRKLHAILPSMSMPLRETWEMCCYYCSVAKSALLPKDFYFWMQQRQYLEKAADDEEEPEEDLMYKKFIDELPPLPPIIEQFTKTAPYWYKIPCVATLQCYCALLATNTRAYYFDGSLLSPTLYQLIYAPAASGKSYVRRLKSILRTTQLRDKLAIQKAKWYEQQVRENNGSGRLPKEVVWKQRIFASKTSLGEILKRQEAIGPHHWLQDVGEFSIWAATIKKAKEEWSAFFRTSYDNEEFMQSYQSPNAYRGKVDVYPIIHGTCTVGQILKFFTDLEDGLLTRFAYVPLLHQRYAEYQPWSIMSEDDQKIIDRVVERLDEVTYMPEVEANKKKKGEEWDYQFKDPITYDLSFIFEPLGKWLTARLDEARKQDNEALDMFRRRCARNAFVYGMICYALFGFRNDEETKEKIIKNVLWDADVKLYYMRYLWEQDVIDDITKTKQTKKCGMRNVKIFDLLPETFTRQEVEQIIVANGYKSRVNDVIRSWVNGGIVNKIDKTNFKKA